MVHEFGHGGRLKHTDCFSVMVPGQSMGEMDRTPTPCDLAGWASAHGTHDCTPDMASCVNIIWLIWYLFYYWNPWSPWGPLNGDLILLDLMTHNDEIVEIKAGDPQLDTMVINATPGIEALASVGYPDYAVTLSLVGMIYQIMPNASTDLQQSLFETENLVWAGYFEPM